MQIGTAVFWLAWIVIVTPFLGVPVLWQKAILILVGALLLLLGYRQRRRDFWRSLQESNGEYHADTFVETTTSLFKKDTVQ